MDATPSFGVTMISEVSSNTQLTLELMIWSPQCVDKCLDLVVYRLHLLFAFTYWIQILHMGHPKTM